MTTIFQIEPSQDNLAFPPQTEKEKNLPFPKACMVVEENRKLKALLKECHTQLLNKPIREIQYDIKMAELKDLLKRIYEAIGEKQ